MPISRLIVAALVFSIIVPGCSSSPKTAKAKSAASTDTLSSSTKQLQQDFGQTQTDLGKLESEVKIPK